MGKIMEIINSHQAPGITGTRDGFGVMKSFYDEKTHKEITNFKEWEKAGYKPAVDSIKDTGMKNRVKSKLRYRRDRRDKPMNVDSMLM